MNSAQGGRRGGPGLGMMAPAHAGWAEWAATTERGGGIEKHQESHFHPRTVEQQDTVTHSRPEPVLRASHAFTVSILPA